MLVIVFLGVVIFIIIPVTRFFIVNYFIISELDDLLDVPFVCPNCGHNFFIKKRQVWYKVHSFYVLNGFNVKCPNCKKTDICSHSHE